MSIFLDLKRIYQAHVEGREVEPLLLYRTVETLMGAVKRCIEVGREVLDKPHEEWFRKIIYCTVEEHKDTLKVLKKAKKSGKVSDLIIAVHCFITTEHWLGHWAKVLIEMSENPKEADKEYGQLFDFICKWRKEVLGRLDESAMQMYKEITRQRYERAGRKMDE